MEHIKIERDGPVGILTIDRPQRFNSLDVETAQDLRQAGLELARDEGVRVVILRGTPGIFCSGADLKYIRAGGDETGLGYLVPVGDNGRNNGANAGRAGAGRVFKQILEYLHSAISEFRRAPKPVIAAVDGIAAAGGFGLAMSCDLVIASERATFEWAYARTGLTGAESSTFLLPRLIGFRRAMELVLLNPRLSAREARDIGLVTAVHPVETFDAEVLTLAKKLASGPTHALGIAKGLLNRAAGIDRLDHHLDQELDELARIADGADFEEGMAAFFEKRSPEFGKR